MADLTNPRAGRATIGLYFSRTANGQKVAIMAGGVPIARHCPPSRRRGLQDRQRTDLSLDGHVGAAAEGVGAYRNIAHWCEVVGRRAAVQRGMAISRTL
ncbi:MAG: hypothetical protein EXQ85_05395 [Alphaproteobacteria bacterium]|nr:hypothetical protein [Alphaproteobacteria bacterium]